jgi:hypothetical protein
VLVKLPALTAVPPLAALTVARRSARAAALAATGGALVVAGVVLAHRGQLGEIWEQAVDFHRHARALEGPAVGGTAGFGGNVRTIVGALEPLSPLPWVLGAGALAFLLRSRAGDRAALLSLWSWPAACLLGLLWQKPLYPHHVVFLAAAAAPAAGASLVPAFRWISRPPVRFAAAAVLALGVAGQLAWAAHRSWTQPSGEPADVLAAAALLREETGPADLVVTDVPVVALYADRRLGGTLADTSYVRFATGFLTTDAVLAAVDRASAVVVGRAFLREPDLLDGIRQRADHSRTIGGLTVYFLPR